MKQFLLNFWEDTKALVIAHPWITGALIVAAVIVGYVAGTF